MTDLPKTFDPADIESRWYAHWEDNGLFRPERPGAEPWTIVNPPPNVTGSLHIGHALDNTLQDILTRHARLQGKDALWVVGTDHAGIATQMVVERQMAERQDKRTNYTREEFVEKVWAWKRESGGQITQQLRRLGCSMDWAYRSVNFGPDGKPQGQFTMDPHFEKAVLKAFVDLYNTKKPDGTRLIYRDKRLVNWDPGLGTAISDLEVETHEVKGSFWHFRYPLADGVTLPDGTDHLIVATTRPETMLADMLVAVNAEDPRYQSVIGKHVIQPITGRRLRIVADDHADPELGSGVVKITPGHDFNDFEVAKRAGIEAREMLNMFDAKAQVVQTADGLVPAEFTGLRRFQTDGIPGARELAVQWMKDHGFLVPHIDKDGTEHDAEPRTIQTPFGDRSGVVIEPWLTDQWYVDAATLAKGPIEAVKSGAIEIVPKSWEKTFFNWMDNIQPWCVSRQLWWGHRIPAWYGPTKTASGSLLVNPQALDGQKLFVAMSEEQAVEQAKIYYENIPVKVSSTPAYSYGVNQIVELQTGPPQAILYRDNDVLDTWFSSALWPFATLGWPDNSSPSSLGEGDHAQHGGGAGANGDGSTAAAPPPPAAVPLPETSSGRNLLGGRYPNDVLVSGFDILFFWDARMMMMGMHFMQDVPFRTLYLHGLVRAADGQKMSKSKGNTVDPLGLIDKFGADALRFFMAAMESQGRDIKMDEKRVEGYRNFATKLWNAARFAQANGIGGSTSIAPPKAALAVNKWIIGEVVETVRAMDAALADYRFDGAANAIYHFVWDRFCDWYLELIKPILSPSPSPSGEGMGVGKSGLTETDALDDRPHPNPSPEGEGLDVARETRAVAGWVLDQILVLLHPFMPFVTEELWSKLGEREYELIVAKWPEVATAKVDEVARREIEWLIRVISDTRAMRNELGIPPSSPIANTVVAFSDEAVAKIERNKPALIRLGRFADIVATASTSFTAVGSTFDTAKFAIENGASIQLAYETETFFLSVVGKTDFTAERARLTKAIAAAAKERDSLASRLNNPAFVEKAKPEAVDKARADHAEKAAEAERLAAALARLG